jgi:Bacterial membrane protein YfhO
MSRFTVFLRRALLRRRLSFAAERHVDLAAGLVVFALTLIGGWDLVSGGILVGMDTTTQFYPWYHYLGESLRSGEIPAWSPHQFSGTPFAGAPLSGWMYLPAMLLFTALPLMAAAKGYLLAHLLLAGLGTYALARALRMNVAGALLAAVAYEFTSYLFFRSICCLAFSGVYAWLPLALLGAELAIRSPGWLDRGLWWGLSGLALSQTLAAWPGQGSYYVLLALGGFVAYRTLLFPPENIRGLWDRASGLVLHGGAVLLFGFALAAAGILPLLEYNALSNLAGGYAGEGAATPSGGWSLGDWKRLLTPSDYYIGLPILALALAAPFIARGRHAVPYFASLTLGVLTLSGQGPTLLHSILYDLLPGFDRLHPHAPQRVTMVLFLGIALMAGATLGALDERGRSTIALASVPTLAALFLVTRVGAVSHETLADFVGAEGWGGQTLYLLESPISILAASLIMALVVLTLVLAYALLPGWRGLVAALLIAVLFVDLLSASREIIDRFEQSGGGIRIVKEDLSVYYGPREAAEFLRSRTREEPARYFGYDHIAAGRGSVAYALRFADPQTAALLVNNAATSYGLQDIQGYNAVHLALYDEYMTALNGQTQNRHFSDVLPEGLDSPLLDLLNVRYIVTPALAGPDRVHLRDLAETLTTAYKGDQVQILENREALPRAWIVHSAKRAKPEEALKLLSSGAVDPGQKALLERRPPSLARPDDASFDRALVTEYEAGRIQVKTTTGAPGLLVLSEVYYPAWKAYVDGEPALIYRADYLLRAIPIPTGDHTVELRYESWSLRVGVAVSLSAYVALVAVAIAKARRWLVSHPKRAGHTRSR